MFTSHYFRELIVKERRKQWVTQTDRLRQIKAIKSTRTNNRKRKIVSITDYIRTLGAFLFRQHERLIC